MEKTIPNIDLHIHTKLSLCTFSYQENPKFILYEDYLVNKLDFYGFTDHFHYLTRGDNFFRAIEERRQFFKEHSNCFLGVEADFVRSSEDISVPKNLRKKFDYIIASVHNISDTTLGHMTQGPKQFIQIKNIGEKKVISNYVADLVDSVNCRGVKVLGHPFVILGFFSLLDKLTDEDLLQVVEACKKNKVAVEISNSLIEKGTANGGFDKIKRLIELSLDSSLKLSLGSDAHKVENAFLIPQIKSLLTEFNVTRSDIFIPKKRYF